MQNPFFAYNFLKKNRQKIVKNRKKISFRRRFHILHDDDDDEEEDGAFVVEEDNNPDVQSGDDPLRAFVGCGAHRLNNAILDTVKDCPIFIQLNSFCVKHHGPKLSNTRWYGHHRQLQFAVRNAEKLRNERLNFHRNFSLLDEIAVTQMEKVHEKLTFLGKFFEQEAPVVDSIVAQTRKIQQFLPALLTNDSIHNTVRLFVATLAQRMEETRRFGAFPDPVIAAALLNPEKASRDMLTPEETVTACRLIKKYAEELESHESAILVVEQQPTRTPSTSAADNPVDAVFNSMGFRRNDPSVTTVVQSTSTRGVNEEIAEFMANIDDSRTAFKFFGEEQKQWPNLANVAKLLLCLLPSPANSERCFSKAAFLSENRRNLLSVKSIRTRLIVAH